jgi:uncharacterized membrane protein YkvA (DUF1232 family)
MYAPPLSGGDFPGIVPPVRFSHVPPTVARNDRPAWLSQKMRGRATARSYRGRSDQPSPFTSARACPLALPRSVNPHCLDNGVEYQSPASVAPRLDALWARTIRRDVVAIWIAAGDPRVPWYAKALAAAVAGYALSPIDLIPDVIPVLGYLDDIIIVPVGTLLTVRLIPDGLMGEFRAEAARREGCPNSRVGAAVIVVLWILAIAASVRWLRAR